MIGLVLAIVNFELDVNNDLIKSQNKDGQNAMESDRFNEVYVEPIRYTIFGTTIAAILMCIIRHLVKSEWIKKYIPEKMTGQKDGPQLYHIYDCQINDGMFATTDDQRLSQTQ